MNRILLSTFSSLIVLAFVIPQTSFAATCTQYGNSTYCSADGSGVGGTTYTQYGNNIYGSDGSSYTTYGNTTYGRGNVINTGGNSGSGFQVGSTAGADMNSPEILAATAKYNAACAPSTSSEPTYGGTAANNCRQAVAEWLQAVSNSQRTYVPPPVTQPSYTPQGESNDEYKKRLLDGLTSMYSTQSQNGCVAGGYLNSHPEGNYCVCDSGYLNMGNSKCLPLSVQSCEGLYGNGSIPLGTNSCQCNVGYTQNSTKTTCIQNSVTTGIDTGNAVPVQQVEKKVQNAPIIKEKSVHVNAKVGIIAPPTATSTVNSGTSTPTSIQNPSFQKKSFWRQISDWFKWW